MRSHWARGASRPSDIRLCGMMATGVCCTHGRSGERSDDGGRADRTRRRPGGAPQGHRPRRPGALQRGPRSDEAREADLVDLHLRGAVDLDGPLHPDVHARRRADLRGDELATGARHHPDRQRHRPPAHPRELAPGHEVRHSLPRVRARELRRLRRQRAGDHARDRRLRLVRHQRVDRRPSAPDLLPFALAGMADAARPDEQQRELGLRRALPDRVGELPPLLGPQHPHRLQGHGARSEGREPRRSVCPRHDRAAGRVGDHEGEGDVRGQGRLLGPRRS